MLNGAGIGISAVLVASAKHCGRINRKPLPKHYVPQEQSQTQLLASLALLHLQSQPLGHSGSLWAVTM